MIKLLAVTAAAAFAGLIIGGASPSSGAAPPKDFIAIDTTVKDLDIDVDNSKDLSIGDQFIDVDILKNEEGASVGKIDAIYTFTDVSDESLAVHADATVTLGGGTLEVSGMFLLGETTGRIAITGGTGVYRAARGELRLSVINDTDVRIVFDFK